MDRTNEFRVLFLLIFQYFLYLGDIETREMEFLDISQVLECFFFYFLKRKIAFWKVWNLLTDHFSF